MKNGLYVLALSVLAACSRTNEIQLKKQTQNIVAALRIPDAPVHMELTLSTKDAALLERVSAIFERYQLYPLRSVSEMTYQSDAWSFNSKRTPMFVTIPNRTKLLSYKITAETHQNLNKETVQKITHDFFTAVESCDACQVTVRVD